MFHTDIVNIVNIVNMSQQERRSLTEQQAILLNVSALDRQLVLLGLSTRGNKSAKVLRLVGVDIPEHQRILEVRCLLCDHPMLDEISRRFTRVLNDVRSCFNNTGMLFNRKSISPCRLLAAYILTVDPTQLQGISGTIMDLVSDLGLDIRRTWPLEEILNINISCGDSLRSQFPTLQLPEDLELSLSTYNTIKQRTIIQIAHLLHRQQQISDQDFELLTGNDFWTIFNLSTTTKNMLCRAYRFKVSNDNIKASIILYRNGMYREDIDLVINGNSDRIGKRTLRWNGIRSRTHGEFREPDHSLPSNNDVYDRLPSFALSKIAVYRDVYIPDNHASCFRTLDDVDPSFLDVISTIQQHEIPSVPREQAIFYGAHRGLDLRSLREQDHWENIKEYIFCKLSVAQPREQPIPRRSTGTISSNVTKEQYVEAYQGKIPRIKSTHLGVELSRIASYPPSVDVETYLALKRIPDLEKYIQYPDASDLSEEAVLFFASRGYLIPELIPDQKELKRRRHLHGCSESTWNLVVELYNIRDINRREEAIRQLLRSDPHPIEEFIFHLDITGELEVASWIGMIVPPFSSADYVRSNILGYKGLFDNQNGNGDIETLTDYQILDRYQAYVDYNSRQEFIDNMRMLETSERFFVPFDRSNAQNEETFYGTPVSTLDVPMVAYGTSTKYWCFEIEELKTTFGMVHGVFRSPDLGKEYKRSEIEQLRRTIRNFPEFESLVCVIDNGLADLSRLNKEEKEFRDYIFANHRKSFYSFLNDLFMTGMYMRRWLGPGHPYPTREDQTKSNISPEERTTPMLVKIKEYIDANLKTARKIQVRNLRNGSYQTAIENLPEFIRLVMNDQKCIRMASSEFIGTTVYYMDKFYGEKIPNFDPATLDHIT